MAKISRSGGQTSSPQIAASPTPYPISTTHSPLPLAPEPHGSKSYDKIPPVRKPSRVPPLLHNPVSYPLLDLAPIPGAKRREAAYTNRNTVLTRSRSYPLPTVPYLPPPCPLSSSLANLPWILQNAGGRAKLGRQAQTQRQRQDPRSPGLGLRLAGEIEVAEESEITARCCGCRLGGTDRGDCGLSL